MYYRLCQNLTKFWYPVGELNSFWGCQSVRWRKPRWLPTSSEKEFLVPKRHITPIEEELELRRLYNVYRARMKSLREHLRKENLRTSATSVLVAQQMELEEKEHRSLMELNQQENARVAALREKRIQEEQEADFARVLASMAKLEQEELEKEKEAINIIRETQEMVKTFIQKEDLEKEIERAIANPKEYNFAIDEEGYVYKSPLTNDDDTEEREHVSSMNQ